MKHWRHYCPRCKKAVYRVFVRHHRIDESVGWWCMEERRLYYSEAVLTWEEFH